MDRLRNTVTRVRQAGVAIYTWHTSSHPSWEQDSETARRESGLRQLDWSRCAPISHQELSTLLVPETVAELPRNDGWGHALEYCLDRSDSPRLVLTMGVRSPGADGRFAEEPYEPGPFPATAADHDVVWSDGFFITWPEAKTAE